MKVRIELSPLFVSVYYPRWKGMDFWIVICCSAAAGILFLGLVVLLFLLLFRETSRKERIEEE